MVDSPMMSTPTKLGESTPFTAGPTPSSRPVTRSMIKAGFSDQLDLQDATSLRERLQRSAKRPIPTLQFSSLEESIDIKYSNSELGGNGDDEDDAENVEDEDGAEDDENDEDYVDSLMEGQSEPLISPTLDKPANKDTLASQLAVPTRRSTRINGHKVTTTDIIDLTVDPAVKGPAQKRTRRAGKAKHGLSGGMIRRSPRFLKPLTEFHKYPDLPKELQIMIWEAAIEPRSVYIRNRSSNSYAGVANSVHNKFPTWFMTCNVSVYVARLHYKKLFGLHWTGNRDGDLRTIQDVSPNNDIVIFEPCHSGCRGYHCARHQYSDEDRSAIRFLAVQTESRTLISGSEPCWQTVTRSWPNVEILYLMRQAVTGINTSNKALIRVKSNDQETDLLKRFEEWKKGAGIESKMVKLEFVVVTEKETVGATPNDRYQAIEDRMTGLPEDIILG
ncbi:hypothetical protein GGR54DRAFT_634291 [Hypoxylon sp. NC1633]|nr:hypothetical protein GGR54DRAFT_634291 [Hypoxylon sp. NC1633]